MLEPNLQKKLFLSDYPASHLSDILSHIDSQDPIVANTWLETLLDILKLLPNDSIISKILPFTLAKGQESQSTQSKLSSIRILTSICPYLERDQILKDIFAVVQSLSQDLDESVRVAVCSLLSLIYVKLDSQILRTGYNGLLLEFFLDKSLEVRDAVFITCCEMMSLLYNEEFTKFILKKCKDHVETAIESEPKLLPQVAKNLCTISSCCEGVSITSDKIWFIECYIKIIQLSDKNVARSKGLYPLLDSPIEDDDPRNFYLQCRINLAISFESMAKVCSSVNRMDFLYPYLDSFTQDACHIVRQKIAEKFGSIATYFRDMPTLVSREFNLLLKDSSVEVIKALIPQITDVLLVLKDAKIIEPSLVSKSTEELCASLIHCEAKVFSETLSWQLYESLAEQFIFFPKYFPSGVIFNCFCKLLFERMAQCRALPSRLACTRVLLVFLRYNNNSKQCSEIRRQIIDLSYSDSFYERMLFVKTCSTVLELFSASYFVDYFLHSIFRLAADKVANIRLAVVFLLPEIMIALRLSNASITPLENVLKKLKNDSDSEIEYQLENFDASIAELMPPNLMKENEKKLQEEKLLGKNGETEPVVTSTGFSFPTGDKKSRWATLARPSRKSSTNLKLTRPNSAAERSSLPDLDMEFMIDAGVPFSKTISSKMPSNYYKTLPIADYTRIYSNGSNIPIVSPVSQSYHFSPLVFHPSYNSNGNSHRVNIFDLDSLGHFHSMHGRRMSPASNFIDHDSRISLKHMDHFQDNQRPPYAEKVVSKSGSFIPKSKVKSMTHLRNKTNLYGSSDVVAKKPSTVNLDLDSMNLSSPNMFTSSNYKCNANPFFNNNKDFQSSSGSSFSLKNKTKAPLKLQSSLISTHASPSSQSASQSFLHSGPPSFSLSQNTNFNSLPPSRFTTSENFNKPKKYSSRLPVRSVKRGSGASGQ